MAHDILIVDDEADNRVLMSGILADEGYVTREVSDSTSALAVIRTRRPSLVILDIWLQGSELDGIELLDVIQREYPLLPVVMISGHGTIETAVAAIQKGAYDFIEKPFKADEFLGLIRLALKQTDWDDSTLGQALTKTERIVLRLILQGMCNRRIAYVLQRSERTIEVHRGHIMQKLGVDNIVDLVKRATAMGIGGEQPTV